MRKCKKCNAEFRTKLVIEGKERNLQNRKFCFVCSPFGSHNTKNLLEPSAGECITCGRKIPRNRRNGRRCYCCIQKERENITLEKVHVIVGTKCWLCPYDKGLAGTPMLDFHHMKDKSFELSKRKLTNHSWTRVWEELQKCMLLCCRCHREVERGFHEQSKIDSVYNDTWIKIKQARS